jgi:hypothetical protein
VGALAFALLALAPNPFGAWLSAGSLDGAFNPLPLLAYLYLSITIAGVPLILLLRFDRPC